MTHHRTTTIVEGTTVNTRYGMVRTGHIRLGFLVIALAIMMTGATSVASAQTESVLYTFTGSNDGAVPAGNLAEDSAGNLYGVNFAGGSFAGICHFSGCGNVFELSPNLGGGWTETVLYDFTGGPDGGNPAATLLLDSLGNLYGTTSEGGIPGNSDCGIGTSVPGCGVVFKLTPSGGGTWTESVLYAFNGNPDGGQPETGVVMDSLGNLFGTTDFYGKFSVGTVYELSPNGSGGYTHKNIYAFTNGKDGGRPDGVAMDSKGNIFVSTTQKGTNTGQCATNGCGTLVEFAPSGSGNFTGHLIYSFKGKHDGAIPIGINVDANGNLFGSAAYGGLDSLCKSGFPGCGVIFEFSPMAGGAFHGRVVYSFTGAADGLGPEAAPTFDSAGNVYATSDGNFSTGIGCCGAVIKLSPSSGAYSETTLYSFGQLPDGAQPSTNGVLVDSSTGTLYGTTTQGGDASCTLDGPPGCGVAYKVTP